MLVQVAARREGFRNLFRLYGRFSNSITIVCSHSGFYSINVKENLVTCLKASVSMTTATRAAALPSGKDSAPGYSVIIIMSEARDPEAAETHPDVDLGYAVFEGSSQEDVAYAKVFWSSLCLQPPIESSLVSVDIRQRLKVAKPPQQKCKCV